MLRHGFQVGKGQCRVFWVHFATSAGERAYGSFEMDNGEEGRDKDNGLRKALAVCR